MDQPSAPIDTAHPVDGIDLKRIWNLLMRNRLFIAAAAGIAAGGAVAYTLWAVPVPVSPRGLLNLLLGLGLGLMAGVSVAFLRERLDDKVHTGEDLREASGGRHPDDRGSSDSIRKWSQWTMGQKAKRGPAHR